MTEPEYDITRKSRPIVIVDYQDQWPKEFREIGARIRETLGDDALRIDHIGSTSVAGLTAKDIIDIQATVADLHLPETFIESMVNAGWVYREGNTSDVFCGPTMSDASQWEKRFFARAKDSDESISTCAAKGDSTSATPSSFATFSGATRPSV